jgi:alpha-N-arabinofuranosidase
MASVDPVAHFFGFRPKESQLPDVLHPPTLPASTLRIDPNLLAHPKAGLISDKLYSGFIEHLGRGIYGGIVDDPKNPSPADLLVKQDDGQELTKGRAAWRKDVMEVLGKGGELEMPMLRWPGGEWSAPTGWVIRRLMRICPRQAILSPTTTGKTALDPSNTDQRWAQHA